MHRLHMLAAFFLLLVLFFGACRPENVEDIDGQLTQLLYENADSRGLGYFMLPDGKDYARIPQDPKNLITAYKVQLGRMLFHETAIGSNPKIAAGMQTYSCASCHHVEAGFQAGVAQGIGEGGVGFGYTGEARTPSPDYAEADIDVQAIRSPTIVNSAFQELMLWNGQFGAVGKNIGTELSWTTGTPKEKNHLGFHGVETQAIAGQTVHRLKIDQAYLASVPQYKYLFNLAFPDLPENERMTPINAGLAIAAYERTVLTNKAPFQAWLRGDHNALSEDEKIGAVLFFGKAGCVSCHTGPALNSMEFYALGMNDLLTGSYGAINADASKPEHKGRGGFTGRPEDMFKFKVPQLYNLKGVHFLGHGAQFSSVKDVVEYKNNAIPSNATVPTAQLSPLFKPLNLTPTEVNQLVAFIENGLYDPDLDRYVINALPSGFCFPNNDVQSRLDRGCQ